MISLLSDLFPRMSRSVLYAIGTKRLNYRKLQWMSNQAADFFEEGIQKLVERYNKCLNIGGNYVEMLIKVQAFT